MILSQWRRYGLACVNFGTPLSVKNYCQEHDVNFGHLDRAERFPEVEKMCRRLMHAVAGVIPILPVSLVSTVFLESPDARMDVLDVEHRSKQILDNLKAKGAPVLESSRSARGKAIADAVDLMLLRGMLEHSGDGFKAAPAEKRLLQYYANAISHWQ